jgi:Cu/Ag efflux protein CusF
VLQRVGQRSGLLEPAVLAALTAMATTWIGAAGAFGVDPYSPDRANGSTPLVQIQESEASGTFRGLGVVTAINAKARALTINHEEIKGFMPAMTMMYRVEPFSLTAGLRPGDKIEFALDAKSYTIHDVKLIERRK